MQKPIYVRPEYEKFWEQLEELAEQKDRSLSYLVNEAVKEKVSKEVV